jgi:hypothetical protein
VHDKGVTRIAFRDNLASLSIANALNHHAMPVNPVRSAPNPPQIHRVNNIFIITFSKNLLMKEWL